MEPRSLALLLVFLPLCLATQCYFPDHTLAADDFPCVDNTGNSAGPCCGPGDICLTNGLCFDGLVINRGSCTDQTWDSEFCTHICTNLKFTALWPCDTEGDYTCTWGDCSSPISLTHGRIQVNSVLSSSLGLGNPTATVTSAAHTVTYTPAVAGHSTPGVSSGAAAGIGAGVGVPLLLTTLGAAALFLIERRRRRRLEKAAQSVPFTPGAAGIYQQPYYNDGVQGIQYPLAGYDAQKHAPMQTPVPYSSARQEAQELLNRSPTELDTNAQRSAMR